MTAQLIDGVALARDLRVALAARAQRLASAHRAPGLAVILVGADPASQVYVRNKIKACADVGVRSWFEALPADAKEHEVIATITRLNHDPAVDGILVQLPLPPGINSHRVIESIAAEKDVDGLQMRSAGALLTGQAGFLPCTPSGIMKMLAFTRIPLAGLNAVVVGRSSSVGKPMGLMLLDQDATVTFCHSKSQQLAQITQSADVLIAAAGRAALIQADMIKPGAIVIDVGINRNASGQLCGDVEFTGACERAGWISPVPGGVGPMTITMLLENTLQSAENTFGRANERP